MDISAFAMSTANDAEPPPSLGAALTALWWAKRDCWDAAHAIVQDRSGRDAAWIHAWLHRVEGDNGNAAYWYRRAQRPVENGSLDDEWRTIAVALLGAAERGECAQV